jgi:hypothetical protein
MSKSWGGKCLARAEGNDGLMTRHGFRFVGYGVDRGLGAINAEFTRAPAAT